jgi:hypothetical protein
MNATSTDLATNAPFDSTAAQAPADRLAEKNRALRLKLWAYVRRASDRMGAQIRRIEGRALVTTPKKGVPDSGSWTKTTARQQRVWLRAQKHAFNIDRRSKALAFLRHAAFLRNERRSVKEIRLFYKRKLSLNTDAGISANQPSPKSDSIIINLTDLSDTDDNDNGDTCRPSRESKTLGLHQQARDSHVALTMKTLDDLGVQVLNRAGVKRGGKRSLSEFLEAEKAVTGKTVMHLEELLKDVKRYSDRLEKGRV